jgi:glycosyltransferase involved in cell wall biosynthesis
MNILFINGGYPAPNRAIGDPFVQQFVWAMARQGHECSVISPTSFHERTKGPLPKFFSLEDTACGHKIHVYRPRFISCSSRNLGLVHTGRWTNTLFVQSVIRTIRTISCFPDIIYGHFLYPAGYAAVCAGIELGVPSVVGVGEGEFWTLDAVGEDRASIQMKNASAFLAVSTSIADSLAERLVTRQKEIAVFPNGVNISHFRPSENLQLQRDRLGFPHDKFIIGYIGPFILKKGYPQLRMAINKIEGIMLVLLGRDTLPPGDSQVGFVGSVPHKEVANYLGACDIFVLPTAIEGSCNSVIEAMACGLPIVTSNGHYMDDIVDDEVAIRVDPMDIDAIRNAILLLKSDPELRQRMSAACLRKAKTLDINERAMRVTAWMENIRISFTKERIPNDQQLAQ